MINKELLKSSACRIPPVKRTIKIKYAPLPPIKRTFNSLYICPIDLSAKMLAFQAR